MKLSKKSFQFPKPPGLHLVQQSRGSPGSAVKAPKLKSEGAATLSPRQREILDLVARGEGDKMIAERLRCSVETVNSQVRRIFQKLATHTRAHAAFLWGLYMARSGDTRKGDYRTARPRV